MDAKSKANFINAVAGGKKIECPHCEAQNDADTKYCIACGKEIVANNDVQPAFNTVDETTKTQEGAVKYVEPEAVFAQGLPEWSIEPPQVMVRRR